MKQTDIYTEVPVTCWIIIVIGIKTNRSEREIEH